MKPLHAIHRIGLPLVAALLVSVLPPSVACAAGDAATDAGLPRLVILVRHAEKAVDPPEDPPLTRAGEERARALAIALQDAGVTAVVTSDRMRARATAEPLARARRLKPAVVGLGHGGLEAHLAAVAAEVRRHAGGVVLVVGHSDTIPGLIAALGGPRLPDIPHTEFGNLYLLVPEPGDGARLVRATYGAPDAR